MEPEGGDVLREALWRSKEDAISEDEMIKVAEGYLNELKTLLADAGYQQHVPGVNNLSETDLYIWHVNIGESRFPAEDFDTEVRVFIPKKARECTTVTCYVREFARMLALRPEDQAEECISGGTRYMTTLSLDICRAMRKENFYTFVGMLCDIVRARDNVFSYRCKNGYRFQSYSLGCLDTKTYKFVDDKMASYNPVTF